MIKLLFRAYIGLILAGLIVAIYWTINPYKHFRYTDRPFVAHKVTFPYEPMEVDWNVEVIASCEYVGRTYFTSITGEVIYNKRYSGQVSVGMQAKTHGLNFSRVFPPDSLPRQFTHFLTLEAELFCNPIQRFFRWPEYIKREFAFYLR